MDQQAQKERSVEMAGLSDCKSSSKTPLPKGMVLERVDEMITQEDEEELKDFRYRTKTGGVVRQPSQSLP